MINLFKTQVESFDTLYSLSTKDKRMGDEVAELSAKDFFRCKSATLHMSVSMSLLACLQGCDALNVLKESLCLPLTGSQVFFCHSPLLRSLRGAYISLFVSQPVFGEITVAFRRKSSFVCAG